MENKITLRHASVAYLAAVTAAAACGCLTFVALSGATLELIAQAFGMAWLGVSVGALLPFAMAIHLANRLNKRSWIYFAGSGIAAALAVSFLVLGASAFACGDPPSPFMMLKFALHVAASGAAGGTACWFALRAQARLDTKVRMS